MAGSGAASRAKVGSAQLAGKGAVTALVLSPDGVRVAIVAGEKLYLGAIAAVTTASTDSSKTAIADAPAALTVINLQQLQGSLTDVGPVAFQSSNELMVVSSNLPAMMIKQLKIDGSDLAQATTNSQYGDVTSMAVSTVDSTAEVAAPDATTDVTTSAAAAVYVTLGQPGALGPILRLQGSLRDGEWVPADAQIRWPPACSSRTEPGAPATRSRLDDAVESPRAGRCSKGRSCPQHQKLSTSA